MNNIKLIVNFSNNTQTVLEFSEKAEANNKMASMRRDDSVVHMAMLKGDSLEARYTKPGFSW